MPREEAVELFSFPWYVPDRGYVWRNGVKADIHLGNIDPPPFLLVHPQFKEEKRYTPLPFDEDGKEDAPLFQRFAALTPSQEEIKAFADTWGWLGIANAVIAKGRRVSVLKGESLERWRNEVFDLRYAVTLWNWLTSKNSTVQVTWESESCVSVRVSLACPKKEGTPKARQEILIHRRFHPSIFLKFRRNDPTLPARVALVILINEKLAGVASPCLLLNRHEQLEGFVRPHNLLAALWVQLYQAIQGQRRIVPCCYCGELMDVTGRRRSKKAHGRCAHNAKMSHYRKKLAEETRPNKR